MNNSQIEIATTCDAIKDLLLTKNMKYGDSALSPIRVLSQSSPIEQILVRIDDKLNRIKQGGKGIHEDEDVIQDLIGYFVLLKIAIDRDKQMVDYEPASITGLTDRIDLSWYFLYTDSVLFLDYVPICWNCLYSQELLHYQSITTNQEWEVTS